MGRMTLDDLLREWPTGRPPTILGSAMPRKSLGWSCATDEDVGRDAEIAAKRSPSSAPGCWTA